MSQGPVLASDGARSLVGNFQVEVSREPFVDGVQRAVAVVIEGETLFALRCVEGRLDFLISSPALDLKANEEMDIMYRVDSGDVHTLSGAAVATHEAVTMFAHGIFDELKDARTVAVRVVSERSTVILSFPVVNGDRAATVVKTACEYHPK